VGDWVAVRQYAPADVAIITEVLPRRTKFSRKSSGSTEQEQVIAANIDLLFIVCGLDHDYNLRRLERYLVAGEQSGARPVIVLNKADLYDADLGADLAARIAEVQAIAAEVPVMAISAINAADEASGQIHAAKGRLRPDRCSVAGDDRRGENGGAGGIFGCG